MKITNNETMMLNNKNKKTIEKENIEMESYLIELHITNMHITAINWHIVREILFQDKFRVE